MNDFSISWRLRKTLACAAILTYLILTLASYFAFYPESTNGIALKTLNLVGDIVWLGLIVLCCNSGALPEHKKTATWVAIGVSAIILLSAAYRYFIWEYQGEDSVTILNVFFLVADICHLTLFVWMIVFSEGGMRVFFGCFVLLYTIYTINLILTWTGVSSQSLFLGVFFLPLGNIGIPFLFIGSIIPHRRDIHMGMYPVQERPLRVGVWGYVFVGILCVFAGCLCLTTEHLSVAHYSLDTFVDIGSLTEAYIWAKVSWVLYTLVMISLTFTAMFINSREGYKANAVILGVAGGLIATISLLGIFITPMSYNFTAIAMALTAVYSLIVLGCSLVTIWVTKSVVEHDAVKYLAFGAAFYLLYLIYMYTQYNFLTDACISCFILALGMLMYIPAGLKYACPRIPAAVNVAVTGLILVLVSWLLNTGIDVLLHYY